MSPADDEVRRFLADSMVAGVAAMSRAGRPFITPLWFVYHRGAIHLPTGGASLAARYVAAQPAVVLLFHAERRLSSKRVLRMRGEAAIRQGMPSWAILLPLVRKYYLSSVSRGLWPYLRRYELVSRYYRQNPEPGPVVIEVCPRSWEFIARVA